MLCYCTFFGGTRRRLRTRLAAVDKHFALEQLINRVTRAVGFLLRRRVLDEQRGNA